MVPTTDTMPDPTPAASTGEAPLFELRNVTKKFGAVTALNNVSLSLRAGECLVLLGENGAGKSTLVGAILGRHRVTEGELYIRGEVMVYYSTLIARDRGVRAVTQEFSLCESLPVYANLFVGQEMEKAGFRQKRSMKKQAKEKLKEVNATFRETDLVETLTRAEQQLVEITKAVTHDGDPGVILFDEPTASISANESERLFQIVDRLKSEGWGILYISHRMEELRRVGDRVAVLRDGKHISTHQLADVTDSQLIKEMAGRDVEKSFPAKAHADAGKSDETILSIENLATKNGKVIDVSLELKSGEILGIGGLVGSGKGDVGAALFGISPIQHGTIKVAGEEVKHNTARAMYDRGIGYLAEDRKREGILAESAVGFNIMIERLAMTNQYSGLGFQHKKATQTRASELVKTFDVRPVGAIKMPISQLSGGNQQKALVARALSADRKALVVVEPTAGVDVGSRMDIYRHLRDQCNQGVSILLISSDVEELAGLSDRVIVMNSGHVTASLEGDDINPDNIVAASFGSQKGANA